MLFKELVLPRCTTSVFNQIYINIAKLDGSYEILFVYLIISDGTVTISGVNLSIVYDPSHLIKGLRNNFLTKNIKMNGKISKWQDIVDVYETDCHHTEARLLYKLNDQHVIPEKIKK